MGISRKMMITTLLLMGCGPKYAIPESAMVWSEQPENYHVQVIQRGHINLQGAISSTDTLDIDFDFQCTQMDPAKGKVNCKIVTPVRFWAKNAAGDRVVESQETLQKDIKLRWKGRRMTGLEAKGVSPVFLGVIRNAIGSLELPGSPSTCNSGYQWKTKDRLQIMRIAGLLGPGSYRLEHRVTDCAKKIRVESTGMASMSGQVADNAPAERYSFQVQGMTEIDTKSGLIIQREYKMVLASSSTQTQPGTVLRQVNIRKKQPE